MDPLHSDWAQSVRVAPRSAQAPTKPKAVFPNERQGSKVSRLGSGQDNKKSRKIFVDPVVDGNALLCYLSRSNDDAHTLHHQDPFRQILSSLGIPAPRRRFRIIEANSTFHNSSTITILP